MDEVKLAIIKRLSEEYGDLKIYDERIQQGFKEPAFFVLSVNGAQKPGLDRRRIRSALYDIHYFPPPKSANREECERMACRLYEILERIERGTTLFRGSEMRHQVIDDVLHFFVSVSVHLLKEKPVETKMQTLGQEVKVK